MEVKKEPKFRMAATRRNLFPRSKYKNNSIPSVIQKEVSNLKGSFKNRAEKIIIWTAMNSRQTAE
jgi:hypothetical protein